MRIVHSLVTVIAAVGFSAAALTFNVIENVPFCDTPQACADQS